MLGLGGWNTRSPWATFAPQTTITRFFLYERKLCWRITSPFQGGSKPPRDLACLLEESEEGGPWFDLFKQFLRHRDQVVKKIPQSGWWACLFQTELEHGLGFTVLAGKAKALQDKLGASGTQKTKEDLREELVNTLLKTATEHLVSDAPQPVVLANQVCPRWSPWTRWPCSSARFWERSWQSGYHSLGSNHLKLR